MTPTQFKAWRKRCKLSQDEAATRLGLSRASVGNYERGERYEDERIVQVPYSVALACDSVAFGLADERNDLDPLGPDQRERLAKLARLLAP